MTMARFDASIHGARSATRSRFGVCAALAISIPSLSAQNLAPGSGDTTFAGWSNRSYVYSVLPQSNSHLFVAGGFFIPGVGTNLVRLTRDGAPDPTFAPTNLATVALTLQPDGNLLAGYRNLGVLRLLPDGTQDSSFKLLLPRIHWRVSDDFWPTALAVQANGRILAAGLRIYRGPEGQYWSAARVYRFLPDGSPDPAFTPFAGTARALDILPDQRILVVGAYLTLLHPDGTRDPSFVSIPFSPYKETLAVRENETFVTTLDCFAIQSDGRILVGGSFTNVQGHARSRLARVLPDGRWDLSFNPPPFTGADYPEPRVYAVAVQEDGRVLVGGILRSDQWTGVRSISRLNPDGSLDTAFSHMIEFFDYDGQGTDSYEELLGTVYTILIQDETKAVIGGTVLDSGNLFRIHLGERDNAVRIIGFRVQPESVTLAWRTEPGRTYYIDYKPRLANADWTPVSGGIISQSTQASWTGLRPSGNSAFYRVTRFGD